MGAKDKRNILVKFYGENFVVVYQPQWMGGGSRVKMEKKTKNIIVGSIIVLCLLMTGCGNNAFDNCIEIIAKDYCESNNMSYSAYTYNDFTSSGGFWCIKDRQATNLLRYTSSELKECYERHI